MVPDWHERDLSASGALGLMYGMDQMPVKVTWSVGMLSEGAAILQAIEHVQLAVAQSPMRKMVLKTPQQRCVESVVEWHEESPLTSL